MVINIVDLKKKIKLIDTIDFDLEDNYYKVSAPAWLYKKVIDKEISWSDFALTFRVNIRRNPDIYSSFIQGFLLSEVEDCKYLLEMIINLMNQMLLSLLVILITKVVQRI